MNNKQTKAIEKKEELAADFGTVYIKRRGDEIMRPIRADMTVSDKKGHLYRVKGKTALTNPAYRYLNKVASISLVTPHFVVVDGIERPNPYVERDSETKAVKSMNVRKIGIGYSPAGNITVIDKTLYFNVYTYFVQSIQAKMKKKDNKGKLLNEGCAKIGTKETKLEGDTWAFFPTAEPLGLWVNYEHPAIVECLEENTQRQRFGERIAQTIVERNILKDHPAIGIDSVSPDSKGEAKVTVYGWRHELVPADIDDIAGQAEAGAKEITVDKGVVEAEPEEEKEAREEAVAEDEEAAKDQQKLFSNKGEKEK